MFTLSQIAHGLIQPGNLLVVLLGLGTLLTLWRRARRLGQVFVAVATVLFVAIAFMPIGTWMLVPLENRFPPPDPMPDPMPDTVAGIVVLGGGQDARLTVDRGTVSIGDPAERMIEAVGLMHRYPHAQVVFTGGLGVPGFTEADVAREIFVLLGADMSRIQFETGARNTYENALQTHELVNPAPGSTWLLVTSASHMPRSMAVFRQAGWSVIAYPVDYRTAQGGEWRLGFSLSGHLQDLDTALHEYVGLIAYWAIGRLDDPWPEP